MAGAVRPLQSTLPRPLQAGALRSQLRASHGGLVRAKTSGRGFRGDLRRLVDSPRALAPALSVLAGHAEAPLPRPHGPPAGRHRPPPTSRLDRHHTRAAGRVGRATFAGAAAL